MIYSKDKIKIQKSNYEDAVELADNLRLADKYELLMFGHEDTREAVLESFEISKEDCNTLFYEDEVALIYGVVPYGNEGLIWMLSSDRVKKFPKSFYKITRNVIEKYLGQYRKVFNFIHEENLESMKLLKLCNAKFSDQEYVSKITGERILKFEIGGNNV